MGWEKRKGKKPKFHDHTLEKYKRKRKYMPDYVTREEWGASDPWDTGIPLPHPTKMVNVVYTETGMCNSLRECMEVVRDLQKTHIEMGLVDIAWNFLIGGDGRKYEGRGWMIRPEQQWKIKQKREKELSIGVVGSLEFYGDGITDYIKDALQDLLHFGICNKYISCCHDIKKELFLCTNSKNIYRY